ncbi:glycosyltransferase family 4 protein [Novosphingobium lentum]|uniref:glycosyltransferase family 4 protein n=1 Tax=Novosphingobium lentum TaxID=145287 RepID=UPI000A67A604|nr:glycosyltransferase family 4 protein [Novosphingobium lentum]
MMRLDEHTVLPGLADSGRFTRPPRRGPGEPSPGDGPFSKRTLGRAPTIMFVLPALGAGGSEHVVTFLANRLVACGLRITIVSFEDGSAPPYYRCDPEVSITYLGVPIGRRGKVKGLNAFAARVAGLRSQMDAVRPDLVISFLTRTNVISVLAARNLRIPVIVSERNNPQRQRPPLPWRVMRRLAYARAYGLVTMTQGALQFFPRSMRQRGWVIPNMADWQHFKPRFTNTIRVLTAVGRLTDQKGFDLLLQAFAKVADRHLDWKLRVWGKGPDRDALQALAASLGIADRVEMPGVSSQPGSWIVDADAFVLSSRYEGWGLVLGEAMAAGLPCVSFDCPFGPAEMISDKVDGLLAPDGDVPALAEALSKVMGDAGLRDRLGANAIRKARLFEPERIGGLWEAMIFDVLASRLPTAWMPERNSHAV